MDSWNWWWWWWSLQGEKASKATDILQGNHIYIYKKKDIFNFLYLILEKAINWEIRTRIKKARFFFVFWWLIFKCRQRHPWSPAVPPHLCQTNSCWCSSSIDFKSVVHFLSLWHSLFILCFGWSDSQLGSCYFTNTCRKDTYGVYSDPVDPEEVTFLSLLLMFKLIHDSVCLISVWYVFTASWLSWDYHEPNGF